MVRIFLAALAVVVLHWSAITEANSAPAGAEAGKCVRVVNHATGEMLANGCSGCRLVSLQRARPGGHKPTSQTLTVPKKTSQPLPFRGPGYTRITAERPCPGDTPEPISAGDISTRKCVRFLKKPAGGAALINPCKVCRTVKVEFVDTAGNRTHRAFAIAPRSPVTFPAAGLAKARILLDTPCG